MRLFADESTDAPTVEELRRADSWPAEIDRLAGAQCLHRLKVNSDSGEGEHGFRGKVNTVSGGR